MNSPAKVIPCLLAFLFLAAIQAKAEFFFALPKIAQTPTKVLEAGSTPAIEIQYRNATQNNVVLNSIKLDISYDPNIVDNIFSIENITPTKIKETTKDLSLSGEIIYQLDSTADNPNPMKVAPGKTVSIAQIIFHVSQTAKPGKITLFNWGRAAAQTNTSTPILIEKSAPPVFNGLNSISSANSMGIQNPGNALILDWRTYATGAADRTKYSTNTLSYKIFRNVTNYFGEDSGAIEISGSGIPYTGNIEGEKYVHQDNLDISDGTPYYYQISAIDDTSPLPNQSSPNILSGVSLDLTPPKDVTQLSAEKKDTSILLKWKNPDDLDLDGIVIIKNEGKPVSGGSLGSAQAFFPYKNGPEYTEGNEPFGSGLGKVIFVSQQYSPEEYIDQFPDLSKTNYYRVITYDRAVDGSIREMGRNYSAGAETKLEGETTEIASNDAKSAPTETVTALPTPIPNTAAVNYFPSPFNPSKGKELTILLPNDNKTNRYIIILSSEGSIIKRINLPDGTTKALWDGRDGSGKIVGNGLLTCVLIAHDRIAKRFQIVIFNAP